MGCGKTLEDIVTAPVRAAGDVIEGGVDLASDIVEGGADFIDQAGRMTGEFLREGAQTAADVTLNVGSFGLLDLNEDWSIREGAVTNLATDFLKEITGAAAAERALAFQQQQVEEARRQAEIDRQNDLLLRFQRDLAGSRSRKTSSQVRGARGSNAGGSSSSAMKEVLGSEQDFLGV